MKLTIHRTSGCLLTIALAGLLVGCQPAAAPPADSGKAAKSDGHFEGDGHDHAEHGHAEHEHAHPSSGPHKGSLIELGNEEYHAELVHDDKAGTVTIYLLDGAAKAAVGTQAADVVINVKHDGKGSQFRLTADPQKGDKAGASSRFVSKDSQLGDALDQEGAEARLVLEIAGKPFTGQVTHSHEGHDHEAAHDEKAQQK